VIKSANISIYVAKISAAKVNTKVFCFFISVCHNNLGRIKKSQQFTSYLHKQTCITDNINRYISPESVVVFFRSDCKPIPPLSFAPLTAANVILYTVCGTNDSKFPRQRSRSASQGKDLLPSSLKLSLYGLLPV